MAKRISRRGSTNAARPELGAEPLRVVRSFYSPVEAHIVRALLEDAGIGCVLSNEFIAVVDSPVSNATGGVQVLVRESDLARAIEVLAARQTV